LPRQNLARWMVMVADWLQPIYDEIRTGVMAGGYVQVETPVHYLCPGHGKTKIGYFWTTSRPGGDVVYQWETSRAAVCLENVLPVDFKGTVQCDAYPAYASFARDKDHLQLAGCWAHLRRKIYEARDQDPRRAGWLLRLISHLYDIERELREHRAGPKLRVAVRAHRSRPLVKRFHRALTRWKLTRRFLPRSGLGLALDYALSNWQPLSVYLDDGRIEIDNNLVENVTQSFGLHFLCRGADNAEKPQWRPSDASDSVSKCRSVPRHNQIASRKAKRREDSWVDRRRGGVGSVRRLRHAAFIFRSASMYPWVVSGLA